MQQFIVRSPPVYSYGGMPRRKQEIAGWQYGIKINTARPEQNGYYFTDNFFKSINMIN